VPAPPVPFCGLAILEALSGLRSAVRDPYLEEGQQLGYQDLQPLQRQLVDRAALLLEGDFKQQEEEEIHEERQQEKRQGQEEGEAVRAIEAVLAAFKDPQARRNILQKLL